MTFHGPGQLVGYPIVNLAYHRRDIHWYLRKLEGTLIELLRRFGIEASRVEGLTGVWVGSAKIATIGIKVSRCVTMHGFALNVNTDLQLFDYIVPCGIHGRTVTSMQRLLGREIPLAEVADEYGRVFAREFGLRIENTESVGWLRNQLAQLNLESRSASESVSV